MNARAEWQQKLAAKRESKIRRWTGSKCRLDKEMKWRTTA